MSAPDLSCVLAGVRLPTPLVLASGILGTHVSLLERVARSGAGAVTAKTCGPLPRRGHPNPTVVDWGNGLINAVGLPNPGVEEETDLIAQAKEHLKPLGVAVIASVFADTPEGFADTAMRISRARPDMIEINVSCPNVASEFGEPYGATVQGVTAVTRACRDATDLPLIVKLGPAVPQIERIAAACQAAGANAICAVNTMPGMVIDTETGRPVLANGEGGISGPALRPIAVRSVWRIAAVVDIPVIGTGGVGTGTDVVEMLMAGATAVGVGSALYYRGPEAMAPIRDELVAWLTGHGVRSPDGVRGMTHRLPSVGRAPTPPPVPSQRGGSVGTRGAFRGAEGV